MQKEQGVVKNFSITDSIKEAWHLVRNNLRSILLLGLTAFILLFAFDVLSALLFMQIPYIGNVLNNLVNIVVQFLIGIAVIHIGFKVADGQKIGFSDLFEKSHLIGKYFISSLLGGFAILLGFLLFIIPGLIIMVRFGLFAFFMVDKNTGPRESLHLSWKAIRGGSWKYFFFIVTLTLLNVLAFCVGALPLAIFLLKTHIPVAIYVIAAAAAAITLFVGLLITTAISVVASVLVYRSLCSQTKW